MSEWATYQNQTAGYSIEYPANWFHEEEPDSALVLFSPTQKEGKRCSQHHPNFKTKFQSSFHLIYVS
jgi:hypothetical protein